MRKIAFFKHLLKTLSDISVWVELMTILGHADIRAGIEILRPQDGGRTEVSKEEMIVVVLFSYFWISLQL